MEARKNSLKDKIQAEIVFLIEARKLRGTIKEVYERMTEAEKNGETESANIHGKALIIHMDTKALYEKAARTLNVNRGGRFRLADDPLEVALKELDELEANNES